MKKIAIQGYLGSFHDIAAGQFFGEGKAHAERICCATFEDVFESIHADAEGVVGLMAIENTIAGSLLHNYELLRDSGAVVVGEHKLHITHCICCLEEDDWSSVTEVHSHPVAFMQCRSWLSRHPGLKVVEDEDTAGSAKAIAEGHLRGRAAICHAEAAAMYGLKVLENHIEDNKHNFTRFLVVQSPTAPDVRQENERNKASLVFHTPHEEGALSHVLSVLSYYHMNMTKIQSLPIIGHEWEYMFYVDITFDDVTRYRQSIEAIKPLTQGLKILGEYKACSN